MTNTAWDQPSSYFESLTNTDKADYKRKLTFHDGGRYHIETSPLICGANQWTGFYMITASVMKGLTLSTGELLLDPFTIKNWKCDESLLPDISWSDIYHYLIEYPSVCCKESLKAYKSLEGYNFFYLRSRTRGLLSGLFFHKPRILLY